MNPIHLMNRQELAFVFDRMVLRAYSSRQLLFQRFPAFTVAWLARTVELNEAGK